MTTETALARRYIVQVDTAYPATAVWATVPGRLEFKDGDTPTEQKDSDHDSDGAIGYTRTASEWLVEMKVSHKEDDASYVIDPTHAYIRARARARYGQGSVLHFRYYDRRGTADAHEGYALPTWAPEGGDDTALDAAVITLKPHSSNPVLADIANPINATPIPVITSLSPATGAAAGGDMVLIYGANFTGATLVEFGAFASPDFRVVDDSTISAMTPAVAASTVKTEVTTPNGSNADTAADNFTFA